MSNKNNSELCTGEKDAAAPKNRFTEKRKLLFLNSQLFNVFHADKSSEAVIQEIAKLLNDGANINSKDANDDSNTPLHMAVLSGDTQVVSFLISMEADTTTRNIYDETPLDLAKLPDAYNGPEMVVILEQYPMQSNISEESSKISAQKTLPLVSDPVPTENTFYTKRPGTSGIGGQLYETKLLALVLLRALTDDNVKSFHLGTNVEGTGAFDDIVMRYNLKGNTKSNIIFLQAKHKENSDKGLKFREKEEKLYFESYLEIMKTFEQDGINGLFEGGLSNHDCHFVLYTPANKYFHKNKYLKESYSEENILYSKENAEIHKFVGATAAEEIDFYSKFRFYTSQAQQNEVETITKKEIKKCISKDEGNNRAKIDAIYLKYHDLVQKWWELPNQTPYLTKNCTFLEEARKGINDEPLLTVLNFVCMSKVNTKKLEFKNDAVNALNLGSIKTGFVYNLVTNYRFLSLAKIVQLFSTGTNFTCIDLDYVVLNNLEKRVFLELGKTSIETLILIAKTKIDMFLETVKELRKSHKILIISDCTWDDPFIPIKDEMNNLSDLTDTSQDEILKQGKGEFQDSSVCLASLVTHEGKLFVNGKIVSDILDNQPIEVGKMLPDPKYDDVKDYYIERTFCCQVMIKNSITQSSRCFIKTDGATVTELELTPDRDIVVISDVNDGFKELCSKFKKRNIHWLKKDKSLLRWQQSHGRLDHLREFVIDQDEEIKVENFTNKVILIAGQPGMGKSTILSKLAEQMQISNPTFWVSRIDLLIHSNKFKRWQDSQTEIDKTEAFLFLFRAMEFQIFKGREKLSQSEYEFISNIIRKNEIRHFDENTIDGNALFEIQLFLHFYSEGKIDLMFDGFDEIDPNYKAEVFKILTILKNERKSRIWVTTRSTNIQMELEDNLSTLAYTLKPFDKDDQINFLEKIWTHRMKVADFNKDRFNIYVNELLESFIQSIQIQGETFISIPLQAKLIAMVFQDNFIQFYRSEDQRLSAEHKRKLDEKLDLETLYKEFFRVKFDDILFAEKYSENTNNVVNLEQRKNTRKKMFSDHKFLAVQSLFDETARKQLLSPEEEGRISVLLKKVESGAIVEKTGIVYRISDGNPIFVHQSFAEYFAAHYLWEKFKSIKFTASDNFIQRIIVQNLVGNNRILLCSFLQAQSREDLKSCANFVDKKQKIEALFDMLAHELNEDKVNLSAKLLFALFEHYMNTSKDNYSDMDQQIQQLKLHLKGRLFCVACEMGYPKLVQCCLDLHDFEDFVKLRGKQWKGPFYLALQNKHAQVIQMLLDQSDDIFSMYSDDRYTIHLAAKNGSTESVERLLKIGVGIESCDPDDDTPLIIAAKFGRANVVELLLQHGADINAKGDAGWNPLLQATKRGHNEVVALLLQRGADIDFGDRDSETALFVAAQAGRNEIVTLLLQRGANIEATDLSGGTALSHAAREGRYESVALLVINGANIEAATTYGFRGLMFAAHRGHWEIVNFLLHHGANIEATDYYGETALFYAVRGGHVEIVALLLQHGANIEAVCRIGLTPLIFAARRGKWEIVEFLLQIGANIEATDDDGQVPFIFAAREGLNEIVSLLLQHGANIEAASRSGLTALIFAARRGQCEMVKFLLQKGANIEATTNDGKTALFYAARVGNTKMVTLLVQHGANIGAASTSGVTALMFAAMGGYWKIVKFLLQNGANIEATNNDGKTALILAAQYGRTKGVKSLLQLGANIKATSISGCTALINAASRGHWKMVKFLLQQGADIEATNKYGETALICAARAGQNEIVALLVQHRANIVATST